LASKKRYGLVLTLGGAPATPHVIAGVPGHFRPNVPTPVGEEGEIPLEDAKAFAKEHDLALVEITDAKAKKAKKLAEDTAEAIRKGLEDAAAVAEGAEPGLINDEKAAVAAAKE
jgi:hypothetical protein